MKEKLMIVFIVLQPIIWWIIYSLLSPIAKRSNSVDGLTAACIFTPLIIIAASASYFMYKDITNTK